MQQTRYFPVATVSLIVLNALIFAIGMLSGEQTQIIQDYGFIPSHIFSTNGDVNNDNAQQNPLTSLLQSSNTQSTEQAPLSDSFKRLFSSMFIHAGIAHIAFNLFALGFLGGYAEKAIGVPRYILIYFTSGIVAALFHGAIASHILHNGDVVLVGRHQELFLVYLE
jgi:rhomboid protease GluP